MKTVWTKEDATKLLRLALDDKTINFRDGQWETIDALIHGRKKILLVQRTGWGKSIVYFISAKILRDWGMGPAVIISPLLALMRNQIAAAERIGIRAVTINSTNQDEWKSVKSKMLDNQIDVLLISPERLSNDEFIKDILIPVGQRLGLLVVDEAHCISDWGHDFRPDYRRIVNVLQQMPPNMPVLGTTATANDRVVLDIENQLGDILVLRGPLIRESLTLQNIRLKDQAARLAWLAEQIPRLHGTGIVYTLTKRDAEIVANWLQRNGIVAAAYYSDVEHPDFPNSDTYRKNLEERLLQNDLKALIATTALGMGYDKPDLGFVIHFQSPGSVVAYYQQVGRAGRAIKHAYGVLLSGEEDQEIHEYFWRSAFPDENNVKKILNSLDESDGLSVQELQGKVNLRQSQIEHVLKILRVDNPAPVIKERDKWFRTTSDYGIDKERIAFLTSQRLREWKEVQQYIDSKGCLMKFLRNALNDPDESSCGRCANCSPDIALPSGYLHSLGLSAVEYLRHGEMILEPKKLIPNDAFPVYGFRGNLERRGLSSEPGRILSRWGDAGWGHVVTANKHAGHFDDSLVDAIVKMFSERWRPAPAPLWVTCVPSLTHIELVPDFARRVASKLQIPFLPVIEKIKQNEPQKLQNNRFYQCLNLDGVFYIRGESLKDPVLLIDDIIDSGWTLTVTGALLRKAGCTKVYPLVLATTAGR
ncbi:MAG TPA: RecQ family ATP-dependent DNA helicase [Paludibacter sp.]|nr:RecQ family ATP-dependent DNA helicase [Paludibacter sp.]